MKLNTQYSKAKHELLSTKLKAYNEQQISAYQHQDFLLTYENDAGELIAGLYAFLKFGIFYIDLLWVDENYRKKKLGSQLLRQAENMARENNALYIRANSGSFQSPEFYLKNNYEQFAKFPIQTASDEQQFDYYFIKSSNKP